jgi:2-iminobutanoate/2-iminopropanoate deaminase
MRKAIRTDKAPPPAAAYEQAIMDGNLIFVSGQVANDPATGKMIEGPLEEQVTQALRNIEAILKAAGADRRDIVRCGVFLADLGDFAAMNRAYIEFFSGSLPARTTVQAGLGTLRVEIDAIAVRHPKPARAKKSGKAPRRR